MIIKHEQPPNYEAIISAFPVAAVRRGVLFAYGDTIYNPDGVTVEAPLLAHEETHCRQQAGLPEEWWKLYIADAQFRFNQELEAHRVEWQAFLADLSCHTPNRHARRVYMNAISHRLASALYGRMVSPMKAKQLINENPGIAPGASLTSPEELRGWSRRWC